jgi:peptide/nickel transport system permease protein
MAIAQAPAPAALETPAVERGRWRHAVDDFVRRRPLGAIGAAIVLVNLLVALGADGLAPYDPLATDYGAMLAAPSAAHWLGTDAFGRDVLSRLIYGSRTAMLVGFSCAFFGATVGAVIGVASAYFGGRVDLLIQRVMDIFLSFPLIILALAVVSILGTGLQNVIMAITIPMIPRAALVARSSALAIREMPYVDAARAAASANPASSCATCCRTSWRRTSSCSPRSSARRSCSRPRCRSWAWAWRSRWPPGA